MTKKRLKVSVAILFMVVSCIVVFAKPAYMDRYDSDPYSKAELRGKCTVCHQGRGGGERNDFGDAFENAGYRITPKLRKDYPDLFETKPRSPE
ncbi:MAG TPA: hypothetical protein VFC63_29340 [Blastocatellia bacterium]|nr:hypothetical protein [Blastocatellia bacterium]